MFSLAAHPMTTLRTPLLLLALLVSGCSSVGEKPFTEMSQLASRMTVVDEVLLEQREILKAVEFQAIAEADRRELGKMVKTLELEFPGDTAESDQPIDPYDYRYVGKGGEWEPLFMKLERLRIGLEELNSGLIGYINSLTLLADGELVDSATFSELGNSLNSGMYSLSAAGVVDAEQVTDGEINLFSFIAGEIARGYVAKKRKEHLRRILEANQPKIDTIVEQIREGVRLTADQVRSQYSQDKRKYRRQITSDELDRESVVRTIYAYSNQVAATFDVLREADRAYAVLGQKHTELLDYMHTKRFSAAELQESIARLEKMSRKLEEARAMME